MSWKQIRLELARTPSFPKGSAGRAYVLYVPLDEDGLIDEEAFALNPGRATISRYWASDPDHHGQVERHDRQWVFRCRHKDSEILLRLLSGPFRLHEELRAVSQDGVEHAFRIVDIVKPPSRSRSLEAPAGRSE